MILWRPRREILDSSTDLSATNVVTHPQLDLNYLLMVTWYVLHQRSYGYGLNISLGWRHHLMTTTLTLYTINKLKKLLVIKYAINNSPSNSVPLSCDELRHAIKALNSGRATDIHGLKAEHLKHSSTKALDHLQWFFNTIISSGRVPGQLHSAYVLQVHWTSLPWTIIEVSPSPPPYLRH